MKRHGQDNLNAAGRIAGGLPGLLIEAEKVAHTFLRGGHGRKRSGQGESFWQFRAYQPGDQRRDIDWRATARRDETFVREHEWDAAQTLWLYRDASKSMDFRSQQKLLHKKDYAEILLLALAVVAVDGGEQAGLLGTSMAPQAHAGAVERLYTHLPEQIAFSGLGRPVSAKSHAVLIGDFFTPLEELSAFCTALAQRQVQGALVQVYDPAEKDLPYSGRIKFTDLENEKSTLEIRQVEAVRGEYIEKFRQHTQSLDDIARKAGWMFFSFSTDTPPETALAKIYEGMGKA